MPTPANCPGGTGYVPDAARQLVAGGASVQLVDLGISGAVIGPDIESLGNAYGAGIPGNLLQNELPLFPADSTLVTILTGPNDALAIANAAAQGAGGSDPSAFISAQIQAFGRDYSALLSGIRSKAPSARVVVANVPNLAALPFAAPLPAAQRGLLRQVSVGLSTQVINPLSSSGIRVVDLLCDNRSYVAANYSPDGYHPNDAGYSVLATVMATAGTSSSYPAPQSTCPQMGS